MSDNQPETIPSSTGFGPPHDLETDSNNFSISGAHLVNDRLQKLYLGFCSGNTYIKTTLICTRKMWNLIFTLISSMNVIKRPQGWGLLTIRRSNRTLVICSWIISCVYIYKKKRHISKFPRMDSSELCSKQISQKHFFKD